MITITKISIFIICLTILAGCSKQPPIDDSMLDGDKISDPSIAHPENYLVSYKYTNPTPQQKLTPVILAVHGYSATTFEWDEFRHYADSIGGIYVSQILLGGHGRDYNTFKKSTWRDWQRPIINEYRRLDSLGYTNISLIGSSTGGPLIVEMIYSGKISKYVQPKHVMFIDPIVISSDKTLSLVDYVGPVVGYVKSQLDSGEQGHWYQYRPQETLNQLLTLIDDVRIKLEKGIVLPQNTTCKVYKSIHDGSADPVSAVLLYKGIKESDGSRISVEMENSSLHVFTRLHGRNSYTLKDKGLQIKTFEDFLHIINHE
jgi:carboxylesterase